MYLSQLFERRMPALQSLIPFVDQPNVFVSFRDIKKLGINPRPNDPTTPIGIYAYPLTKSFYTTMEDRMIPYAGHRDFIYLFRGEGNIVDLGTYSETDLSHDIDKMKDMFIASIKVSEEGWVSRASDKDISDYAINAVDGYAFSTPLGQNTPADRMWAATRGLSRRLGIMMVRDHSAVWNGLMRRLGYDGLVDPGMSVIHKVEKSQAVFFSKASCKVIDVFINDL